jgi:hypothetical protein
LTAQPGTTRAEPITVTNTSVTTQTITPSLRVLGPATTLASGTLTLTQATDPTLVYQTGAVVGDVHQVKFTVPAGLDQLDSRIAWMASGANASSTIRESLFDPSGAMVAQSRPQGNGAGYGDSLVHNPTPGKWTLLVFETVPYTGKLAYTITGATFTNVANGVVPPSRVVTPGGTANFVVEATTPSSPGDLAESVTFQDSANSGPPLATIPVLLRSTVPVHPSLPGTFSGSLTGGNERMGFYGQELVYQFQVPAGITQINVNVTVGDPGYQVLGFLADPNIMPADVQSTLSPNGSGANYQTMHLSWHDPIPGLWNLDLTQINSVSSLHTSVPISGTIDFNAASVSASGLPTNGTTHLANGVAVTGSVKVTNTGNSYALYSLDPRLNTSSTIGLASLTATGGELPIDAAAAGNIPQMVVPPFSTQMAIGAESTVPIAMDVSPDFGTPDLEAGSVQNVAPGIDGAIASLAAPDIPASLWSCAPSEIGPFPPSGATPAGFGCGAIATTNTFDPTVTSGTGNIWSALEGLTSTYSPLVLGPGQTGSIPVTITPTGTSGTVESGFIAVETFNFNTFSSDQLTTVPYKYTVS